MVRQEGAGCFRGNERQWVLERMGKWRRQSWRVGMGGHLMGLYQLYPQKSKGRQQRGPGALLYYYFFNIYLVS